MQDPNSTKSPLSADIAARSQLQETIREKFQDFPDVLTSKLLTEEQMTHVKPEQKIHYTIVRHFPSAGINYTTISGDNKYTSLSEANMAVLEHFLDKHRTKLVGAKLVAAPDPDPANDQDPNKPAAVSDNLVARETVPAVRKSRPGVMYSVQGETIGWRYGTNGCLAVLTTAEGLDKADVWYVRKVVEV
jgi:hypothetical protein